MMHGETAPRCVLLSMGPCYPWSRAYARMFFCPLVVPPDSVYPLDVMVHDNIVILECLIQCDFIIHAD